MERTARIEHGALPVRRSLHYPDLEKASDEPTATFALRVPVVAAQSRAVPIPADARLAPTAPRVLERLVARERSAERRREEFREAGPSPVRPRVEVARASPVIEPPVAAREEAAPVVRITIGRVEVRAVHPPSSVATRAAPTPDPRLSLAAYRKQRREDGR
jgi:hypothetical protein